jgi:DNA-binding NarL/FixJ family response regulator
MTEILIVDDDATLAMELEEFLPTIGHQVVGVATSGSKAVKMARKHKPALVLMDIKMPGKLDGIKAAGIIKSELGINIIFISGHADEKLLEQAKLVEPLGYIHKPFTEEQIAAVLKMVCYQININEMWPKAQDELPHIYKNFTLAEIRIGELLKQGRSTKEIGLILNLSPATVIWHRKNIRKKLLIAEKKTTIQSILLSNQA